MTPQIGEIITGRKIGKAKSTAYVWVACRDCGDKHWARKDYSDLVPEGVLCRSCHTKRLRDRARARTYPPGSKIISSKGYVLVKVSTDDFFFPMADCRGFVSEHRLAMAMHLKRRLLPWEIIHHKNGNKTDNRLENLKLFSIQAPHVAYTEFKKTQRISMQKELGSLKERVIQLETEVAILRRAINGIKGV